jgi:hypothetical protein
MIKNIPKDIEFEQLALDCITKSFEMLYRIDFDYKNLGTDVKEEDYWKHNDITVRTSLIVLFQGVEYLMKMKITEKSALLLIENNRTDWPTIPDKRDKNFDELITISGENLLSVFCAITDENFKLAEFAPRFEELRKKRNKLVHSTGVNGLDYKYIIKEILFILSIFYFNEKWIELLREKIVSEPTFGHWDTDEELASYHQTLDFVEHSLNKAEINKYIPYNINSRRYFCPYCTYWLSKEEEAEAKWAFLNPNTADSKKIHCLVCDKEHDVTRDQCQPEDECKGNVLSNEYIDKQCLTCYSQE